MNWHQPPRLAPVSERRTVFVGPDAVESITSRPACPDLIRKAPPARTFSGTLSQNDSPRLGHPFSCCSTLLSPFLITFAHHLRADRGRPRTHSRKPKCAYPAQFWCNASSLDATLLGPLVCVANKGFAQYLSPVDATLTKNRWVGVSPSNIFLPASSFGYNRPALRGTPAKPHALCRKNDKKDWFRGA